MEATGDCAWCKVCLRVWIVLCAIVCGHSSVSSLHPDPDSMERPCNHQTVSNPVDQLLRFRRMLCCAFLVCFVVSFTKVHVTDRHITHIYTRIHELIGSPRSGVLSTYLVQKHTNTTWCKVNMYVCACVRDISSYVGVYRRFRAN